METDPTEALDVRCSEEEGELLDQDKNSTTAKLEQVLSEEQIYQETVQSIIQLYMGCSHIPNFDNSPSSAVDNSFTWPKQHSTSKISVNLPTDEWLCKRLDRLNITLVEGYP